MTIHHHEQIMAWREHDITALGGRELHVQVAADSHTFWADPHRYDGDWETLGAGLVSSADTDRQHPKPEWIQLWWAGGGITQILPGQAIRVIEEDA